MVFGDEHANWVYFQRAWSNLGLPKGQIPAYQHNLQVMLRQAQLTSTSALYGAATAFSAHAPYQQNQGVNWQAEPYNSLIVACAERLKWETGWKMDSCLICLDVTHLLLILYHLQTLSHVKLCNQHNNGLYWVKIIPIISLIAILIWT